MATSGADALTTQLGGPPPTGVTDHLDDEALGRLATLVAEAKEHQVAELARGGEEALRMVPRLLRLPLRRALGL